MHLQPVILRELLIETRRPINHYLRWLGVALFLPLNVSLLTGTPGSLSRTGFWLFSQANMALFAMIWMVAPLMVCHCLSREYREGTLRLLILTPLSPWDIVLAKALVHSLRVCVIVLAALPALFIPVLMGGVSGLDVARVALLDLGALIIALATGLYASSLLQSEGRTAMLALLFSGLTAVVFGYLHATYRVTTFFQANALPLTQANFLDEIKYYWSGQRYKWVWLRLGNPDLFRPAFCPEDVKQLSGASGGFASLAVYSRWKTLAPANKNSVRLAGAFALACGWLALAAGWFAVRRIQRFSRHDFDQTRLEAKLSCCPAPRSRLPEHHHRLCQNRERFPVSWLTRKTLTLEFYEWALVLFLLGGMIVSYPFLGFCLGMGLFVYVSYLPNRFARELTQSGWWELVMTIPISPGALLWQQLRVLWIRFIPIVAILSASLSLWIGVWVTTLFLTLPIAGFYFSLRRYRPILATGLSILIGGLLPMAIVLALGVDPSGYFEWLNSPSENVLAAFTRPIRWRELVTLFLVQSLVGLIGWRLARDTLSNRDF